MAAYAIEGAMGAYTGYTLLDDDTVRLLAMESGALVPEVPYPKTQRAKDVRWNRQRFRSAITQGILQGESVPKVAKRVQSVVGMDSRAATRAARTALTGAQNAGRVNAYGRMADEGCRLKQEWMATRDVRTRDSHRKLDGERVEIGGSWQAERGELRFPGDPQAHPAETWNCRCRVRAVVDGIDQDTADRFSRLPAGTTYDQWKAGKLAEAAAKELQASLTTKQATSAKAVRAIVSKVVPLGVEKGKTAADYIDLSSLPNRHVAMFNRAMKYVPTKMLKTVQSAGVKAAYDPTDSRSGFYSSSNTLVIGWSADELTVVHELMHAVEAHDPDFLDKEREYFDIRTATSNLVSLKKLTGLSYRRYEKAYDVKRSINVYAFKDYKGSAYELMSMGVETLYRSPSAYFKDIGMLKWVLEMIGRFGS